ncbi:hypothetical protein WR25_19232 [Diploscapter pachys]|uniref:Uncharacterized protein n=1 Tax=Diploscapter pachys TaxID=2018661 RepID=A0A2A2K0A0_9BILA|nr:hypothetical protein WR25_19232 [Diploscapter pachys]
MRALSAAPPSPSSWTGIRRDQARIAAGPFDGRHERVGTGGQDQLVVAEAAFGGDHFLAFAIDVQYRLAQVQVHAVTRIVVAVAQGQGFGATAGEIFREATMFRHELAQGRVHVPGHKPGIATDIHMRAVLQPAPQLGAVLQQAVLHIDLLRLVTRERGAQTHMPAGLPGLHLFARQGLGVFAQHVGQLAAPQPFLEFVLALWQQQALQVGSVLAEGFELLAADLGDVQVPLQRGSQGHWGMALEFDLGLAFQLHQREQLVDQIRAIARPYAQGIARLIAQVATGQVEDQLASLLG